MNYTSSQPNPRPVSYSNHIELNLLYLLILKLPLYVFFHSRNASLLKTTQFEVNKSRYVLCLASQITKSKAMEEFIHRHGVLNRSCAPDSAGPLILLYPCPLPFPLQSPAFLRSPPEYSPVHPIPFPSPAHRSQTPFPSVHSVRALSTRPLQESAY